MKHYAATPNYPHYGPPGDPKRSSFRFTPSQKSEVYDAIFKSGANGITRPDIAKIVGLRADRISFYLSDLRRSGHIEVKGEANPNIITPNMNAQEAAFAAMLALEGALVQAAKEMKSGPSAEQERAFGRYQKIKELALRPGTGPEGRTALRMALIELVKVVY